MHWLDTAVQAFPKVITTSMVMVWEIMVVVVMMMVIVWVMVMLMELLVKMERMRTMMIEM